MFAGQSRGAGKQYVLGRHPEAEAAIGALQALGPRVVLIAGGSDKGQHFAAKYCDLVYVVFGSHDFDDCKAKVFITSKYKADQAAEIRSGMKGVSLALMLDGVIDGYESFLAGRFGQERDRFRNLSEVGQNPRIMLVGWDFDARIRHAGLRRAELHLQPVRQREIKPPAPDAGEQGKHGARLPGLAANGGARTCRAYSRVFYCAHRVIAFAGGTGFLVNGTRRTQRRSACQ